MLPERNINLTETILCTWAVEAQTLERRAGKVINITSWRTRQGVVVCTIAWTTPIGFTRAQAPEWAL